jgi:histidinol-phosphatase
MSSAVQWYQELTVAFDVIEQAGAEVMRLYQSFDAIADAPADITTDADLASQEIILRRLSGEFSDDRLCAEETTAALERERKAGKSETSRLWVVDPIDGTRGFARGATMWGPMIALEVAGELVVGAFALPAQATTYWAARGQGAFRDGTRLAVSQIATVAEATLSVGELARMMKHPGALALIERAASTRCYGDIAGCALVLDGRAEAWIEGGVKPWDLAAPAIIVAEAGGRFSDWTGAPTFEGGYGIASNGRVHDEIVSALR